MIDEIRGGKTDVDSVTEAPRALPQEHRPEGIAPRTARRREIRRRLSHGFQQWYFLRFPLLGWLTLTVLCAIDWFTPANTVTRGIMTMSRSWQAFYAAFFIAALMNTVLICAKNIVRNGGPRFAADDRIAKERIRMWPDGWLDSTCASTSCSTMSWVLAVAHIPTMLTLAYIGLISYQEKETGFYLPGLGARYWHVWVGFAGGLLAALLFWYGVSVFYLWVYPLFPETSPGYRPAGLLLPITYRTKTLPGMAQASAAFKPKVAVWADWAVRPLAWISHAGYAADEKSPIWEYHTFAVVALGWFFTLYLFLYPLTAPVVCSRMPVVWSLTATAFASVLLWGTLTSTSVPEEKRKGRNPGQAVVWWMRSVIILALLVFLAVIWYNAKKNTVVMENAFPVLSSLLVILIFLQWFISGASFFFDRFRVPVLTASLLLLLGTKVLLRGVDQDHYFEARDIDRVQSLNTPLEAMLKRIKTRAGEPYIIVTATGGGIQAAEWTAQVMAQMEKRFRNDPGLQAQGYTFHDHLLLASGVSGGSVGLMPYLLEYTTQLDPGTGPRPMFQTVEYARRAGGEFPPDLLTRRLTLAPGCSSLEAVAWGLVYYDLERMLLTMPLVPSVADQGLRVVSASSPDRTWALAQAFNRNFSDRDCGTDPAAQPVHEKFSDLPGIESAGAATLSSTAQRLDMGIMPAFTFNTTVAETGGRFLLSNYGLNPTPPQPCGGRCAPTMPGTDFLPAESFLQAYGQESNCDLPQVKRDCYADISLATAAQLSATFPFVSSASRIPQRYATRAAHFVDGGYFDNDGTGSVTEFLFNALQENAARSKGSEAKPRLPDGPIKFLLVEIRDGDDMDPTQNDDDLDHQTGKALAKYAQQPKAWTDASQAVAPLEGMWRAGHESITRRNRRELCLFTKVYSPQVEIHHVVLGIPSAPVEGKAGRTKVPPLNWKLTKAQLQYIESWATADGTPTQTTISQALNWVRGNLRDGDLLEEKEPPCTVYDQTYMRSDMR